MLKLKAYIQSLIGKRRTFRLELTTRLNNDDT